MNSNSQTIDPRAASRRLGRLVPWALLVTASLVAAPASPALASETVKGVACHGCSAWKMKRTAERATNRTSTVFVFNQPARDVRKYDVRVYVDDARDRLQTVKEVVERPVSLTLEKRYRRFAESVDRAGDAFVVLPEEFGVRSVAAAYTSPGYAATTIEDYMQTLSYWERVAQNAILLAGEAATEALIFANQLIQDIIITVQFPDGSTAQYAVSLNLVYGDGTNIQVHIELSDPDEGRLANGSAMPESGGEWAGFRTTNEYGSLMDWVFWAQENGIVVTGPGGSKVPNCPVEMICEINGSQLTCVVTGVNC